MAINPINLSNTFAQLVTTTRQCGDELNLLKSGEYVKGTGILNITAPGTSFVANSALFYNDVSISKTLTVSGDVESKVGYVFPDGSTQITAAQSSEYSNSAYAHANSVYALANNTANTLTTTLAELQTHEANYDNPHNVSAEQLNLADVATTGSYNDLTDTPVLEEILSDVAFSGSYDDLTNTPNIVSIACPIGMIYVQYPNQSAPSELFGGEWENVSNQYAGQFFRAEGGGAVVFGESQTSGAPNIVGSMSVENNGLAFLTNSSDLYITGCFSSKTLGWGSASTQVGTTRPIGVNFSAANSNAIYGAADEVRPTNSTIRIWKRTA